MNKLTKIITALGISIGLMGSANASVIFSDNFDTENGGVEALNYTGFANWNVLYGSVDLIGNGGTFDFLPGNGMYVDLDGSTGTAGLMGHVQMLTPGDYTLSFDLAGNQRNTAAEYTTVNVGVVFGDGTGNNTTISLGQYDPFTTYSLDFSVSSAFPSSLIDVTFGAAGGDNIGMLLDNVQIADRTTTNVPEPNTLALIGASLLGIGFVRRKTA